MKAFGPTLQELEPLCHAISREYFPPPGMDREDLLQEAHIGAWKARRNFRAEGGASFHTFAAMCIRRQVITSLKTATRQKHLALNEAVSLSKPTPGGEGEFGDVVLASSATDPERCLIDRERLTTALQALRMNLTMLEQRSFIAVELDGLSYEDAAEALGETTKTIDNAIQRARRGLSLAATDPTCDICGAIVDRGRRCDTCQSEIDFAKGLLAA